MEKSIRYQIVDFLEEGSRDVKEAKRFLRLTMDDDMKSELLEIISSVSSTDEHKISFSHFRDWELENPSAGYYGKDLDIKL